MAKINETLRRLRLDRGMTQEEVANQVGLTRQAVSGYESGRTQPGIDMLQRLADIYEVDLADLIYGRNQVVRLYNGVKITAMVMAFVFLAVQLTVSVLMWVANRFYALVPGQLDDAEKLIWAARAKLMNAWTALDGFHSGVFPLCCVALLVLTLCLRRPLGAKSKLLCVGIYATASMVVILPWALGDTFYPAVNYLITPALCLAQLVFFLLVSLLIDFFRTRRLTRDTATDEPPEDKARISRSPIFHRWWVWTLIGLAFLLVVSIPVVLFSGNRANAAVVDEPCFSLNGETYPQSPTLQDFLDRGWKLKNSVEQIGNYSEESGVSGLVHTGYRLSSGENHISAYLVEEDVRSGLKPKQCKLRSLSLYGANVMSFALDGKELVHISSETVTEVLGEPSGIQTEDRGVIFDYSMPEDGISKVTFSFPNALDSVGQILVVFEDAEAA